ncbi:MAG: DUF3147 family protein [Candidatus Micrarchaeota archaeon]
MFLIKVFLSFIVAGVWITLVTILAEKLGTKIGGIIGSLPSNTVISLFFIGLTQTPEFAANAAKIVPLALVMSSVFLFIFIVTAKKYGKLAFVFALLAWFILAIPLGNLGFTDVVLGTAIYAILSGAMFYILEYWMNIQSMEKKVNLKYSPGELLLRAVFAGGVVSGAVVIAAFLGSVWGGIFSTFPAVVLSTMFLLTRAQGVEFAQATGKVLLPGYSNIVVYGIAVSLTYPTYGLVWGTVISYSAAALYVIAISPLLRKMK